MRDPNRIEPFLEELGKLWKNSPAAVDMRFGQFMLNVLGEMSQNGVDPWFHEEDKFLEEMKKISWIKGE